MSLFQLLVNPETGDCRAVPGNDLPVGWAPAWRFLGAVDRGTAAEAMADCNALASVSDGAPLPAEAAKARAAAADKERSTLAILENIASSELGIPTLRTRMSDSLDFSEQAVWSIRQALVVAFRAGEAAAKEQA